jgi:hypothetical protein
MKRHKIQIWVFMVCVIVISLLILFSYMGVIANDEGHATKTTRLLENLFSILAFPTLNLLVPMIRSDWGMPYLFFIGLFVNALLYAWVVERLYTWIAMKRRVKKNEASRYTN